MNIQNIIHLAVKEYLLKEGYYSKDIYQRKEEWAAKRMAKNAENENLTEEQHDALADLCRLRHEFHTSLDNIATGNDNNNVKRHLEEVNDRLDDLNLGRCKAIDDVQELADMNTVVEFKDDYDCPKEEDFENDDDYQKAYDDWRDDMYTEVYNDFNNINNEIETYLRNIDKKYGTNYAPSGMSRE
jgi:hypothetical protein